MLRTLDASTAGGAFVRMERHLADASGQRCARCGEPIALPPFRYVPGVVVTVAFRDPRASWRSPGAPSC